MWKTEAVKVLLMSSERNLSPLPLPAGSRFERLALLVRPATGSKLGIAHIGREAVIQLVGAPRRSEVVLINLGRGVARRP